jgi:CrcB protein
MARYLASSACNALAGGAFPLGTLVVNVTGCLIMGFCASAFAGRFAVSDELKLALLVGFLGALTTFSSYGWETFALLRGGYVLRPAANILLNNILGLAAVYAGFRAAEAVLSP